MKLALLSMFSVLPMFAAVHERTVEVEKSKYIVSYDVPECDPKTGRAVNCTVFVPATGGTLGQPHYDATITVFRREGSKRVQVGEPFVGQWTEKGCFEDDPKTLTEQALKHQNDEHVGEVFPGEIPAFGSITCITPDCPTATARIPILSQCSDGHIDLLPEASEGNVVTIKARVCREGKWVDARVLLNEPYPFTINSGVGTVHNDGPSCYGSYQPICLIPK